MTASEPNGIAREATGRSPGSMSALLSGVIARPAARCEKRMSSIHNVFRRLVKRGNDSCHEIFVEQH